MTVLWNHEEVEMEKTEGGRCRCGEPLPDVRLDETPFEFCSKKCKAGDGIRLCPTDSVASWGDWLGTSRVASE